MIYKILEPLILSPLTYIINLGLTTCKFPNIWKKALVIPIHKGGNAALASNYRPISLLPILSKVYEKILSNQMRFFVEAQGLIASRQFGFRAGTSTEQVLIQLVTKIRKLMTTKSTKCVTLAALDIKKAFDCVNHGILIRKLHSLFGFSSNACNLVTSYLCNREQVIKTNNVLSERNQVQTGVPQGSVLGPLLFLIFINDLMSIPECYLYADDCLLISPAENPQNSTTLMEILIEKASAWYDKNLLVLNSAKTDVMTISNKKYKVLPNLIFKNNSIKQSDKLKYLGVILDNKLNFKRHIKSIKRKIYPIITNFSRNRPFLSPEIASLWYTGLIRPNLEYCAALLLSNHGYILKELLKIENRCLKIINLYAPKLDTRHKFNIHFLSDRLKYLYLLTFYKIAFKLVPIIDQNILPIKSTSYNMQTRLNVHCGFLLGKADFHFSLRTFGAKMYNDLPPCIMLLTDIKDFKSALRIHILNFQ
jgi:hypothetical protein